MPTAPLPICAECSAELSESDAEYCADCLTECEHCGTRISTESAILSHASAALCDGCAWRCDDCRRIHSRDETRINTANGDDICEQCYSNTYFTCDTCCEVQHCNDAEVVRDGTYCGDCAQHNRDDDDDSGVIRSYHSTRDVVRVLPSPWSRQHGGRVFGVELEVEVRDGTRGEAASRIASFVNNQAADITADNHRDTLLHFEQDGSLTNGFEMVSAPLGLDDHSRLWKTALSATLTKGLRSHDTDTCGLHVHVSRVGLSDVQIAKAVCFVNDPDNRTLIEAVARRYDAGYCKVGTKKLTTAHKSDGDRYQAINLCNRNTIEFRIFKGTLRYASVMAAIEFANAVVQFAGPANGVGYNLKTPAFLDYINTNPMRKHTGYLRLYLSDKLRGVAFPEGFRPTTL